MTEQKAIDEFNLLKRTRMFIPHNNTIDFAIKALEKQIPKKPKIVEVDMEGMDMETGEEYTYKMDEAHCSACDSIIGNEYDCFDDCHCSKCGQKIDWSVWE